MLIRSGFTLAGFLTVVLDGMRKLFPNFDDEVHRAGGL